MKRTVKIMLEVETSDITLNQLDEMILELIDCESFSVDDIGSFKLLEKHIESFEAEKYTR